MKVSPETTFLKNDLANVNKRIETLRKARTEEEEELKKRWKTKIDDTKADNMERVSQTELQGQDDYSKEILWQEEKLKNIRDSYEEQNNKIKSERELLSNQFELERQETAKNQFNRISDIKSTTGEQENFVEESVGKKLYQMALDRDRNLRSADSLVRREMSEKYSANQKILKNEDMRFKDLKNKTSKDSSMEILTEKIEHEKELGRIKTIGSINNEQQKQIYEKEMLNTRAKHQEMLKSEVKSFEQKLNSQKNLHETALASIKAKNGAEMQSLLSNQSSFMTASADRSEDPFYSPSLLTPVVEDKIKYYELKMAIPEYEEKNVMLSGNKRDLKIAHSRKVETKVDLPDGSSNKSNRHETFLKEISLKDIIDPSKITRNYNDGVLTFRIDKL